MRNGSKGLNNTENDMTHNTAEKRRELIEVGYVTYSGRKVTSYQAARYNYAQGRINACIDAGVPVGESLLFASFLALQDAAHYGDK